MTLFCTQALKSQTSNPTNSARSISNVRTRSATVSYEFNISNPCVREDNVSNAERDRPLTPTHTQSLTPRPSRYPRWP